MVIVLRIKLMLTQFVQIFSKGITRKKIYTKVKTYVLSNHTLMSSVIFLRWMRKKSKLFDLKSMTFNKKVFIIFSKIYSFYKKI
jgi:hypothetical protein